MRVRRHRLGYSNRNYHALIFRFVSDGISSNHSFFFMREPEKFRVKRFAAVAPFFFCLPLLE